MKEKLLIIPLILLLMACGGKKNNPAPVLPPVKALLTSPVQNEVCTTGTIISDAQSSVAFMWQAADNSDSYDLVLKNLLTNATTTQNTAQTQLLITLARNTPFSWYIVSKSNKTTTTAQSDAWKFYNSGPGVVTYPPYPAEITSPTFGQAVTASGGTVNLTWTGNSVEPGTIVNYDVHFGTTASPGVLKSDLTDSFLNNVTVTSGTTYYWRVITKDVNGNTSDSGLYQFKVN